MLNVAVNTGALRVRASASQILAFAPVVMLMAFWIGGEVALAVTAIALPLVCHVLPFHVPINDAQPDISTPNVNKITPKMAHARPEGDWRDDVNHAVSQGQVQTLFQPQISSDTGAIMGFAAHPCWNHPTRGPMAAKDIHAAASVVGQSENLTAHSIFHVFSALDAWDAVGAHVPNVTLPICHARLGDRYLANKLKWELDRFGLTADRLCVEISDSDASSTSDAILESNCRKLAALGCRIDLRCANPSAASRALVTRHAANRLSFAIPQAQSAGRATEMMVPARTILNLADAAHIETRATGICTAGEHTLLSQLGYDLVQGNGVAKPMTFDQTLNWIDYHGAKLPNIPIFSGCNRP